MDTPYINTALDIVSRVGAISFTDLGGMLLTSKLYHSLASHPTILNQVSLEPFLSNAELVHERSFYRPFFVKCLRAHNPTAVYLESIRFAVKLGRAEDALRLLCTIGNYPPHASFARALLQVCLGSYLDALHTVDGYVNSVGSFHQADAIGSRVFRHILQMRPVKVRSHSNTWRYDDIPACIGTGCGIDSRCRLCFLYWFSVMYLLLC